MSNRLALPILIAVTVALGHVVCTPVKAGSPAPFTTAPSQISYFYQSPSVSLYADVQTGNAPSANVSQNSARNLSGIVQVGNSTSANVRQTGQLNQSGIGQWGRVNNATVIQFGYNTSLLGN